MTARIALAFAILFSALAPASAQIPSVNAGGVVNAASFAQAGEPGHAVAPGSLVSIFGQFLGPDPFLVAPGIPLPTELGGISVRFNGKPAPLTLVSAGQINAQLPWDVVASLPPGSNHQVSVVVTRNGLPSGEQTVQVAEYSPGIFTLDGRRAVAVNALDGTLAQPPGTVAGLVTRAAARGSIIILYANGLGAVDTPLLSGELSPNPITRTVTTPVVLVGGVEAPVLFSGLAPQFAGLNQLNVMIPETAPAGDAIPIQIRTGGITTSIGVTIAVSR